MTDLQLTALVVLIIARLRAQFPKLDGAPSVLGLSVAIAILLELAVGWTEATTRILVLRGLGVAAGAAGGMQALAYHAEKFAAAWATPRQVVAAPDSSKGTVRPRRFDRQLLGYAIALACGVLTALVVIALGACMRREVCQ